VIISLPDITAGMPERERERADHAVFLQMAPREILPILKEALINLSLGLRQHTT
jgi:hypothetical protein